MRQNIFSACCEKKPSCHLQLSLRDINKHKHAWLQQDGERTCGDEKKMEKKVRKQDK